MPLWSPSLVLCCAVLAASPDSDTDPPEGEAVVDLVALQTDEVVLSAERWRSLRPDQPREPGPMVLRRELRVTRVEGGVELHAQWWLRSEREAWFANALTGPDAHVHAVRWDGADAAVWTGAQGPLVVERIDGPARLELRAFVPGRADSGLELALLGAPRGTVVLEGFADDIQLSSLDDARPVITRTGSRGAGRTSSTGASGLRLAAREPPARDRGPVVVAHVGMGVTVGDAEIRGRARLRWEIRQGSREALEITAANVGADLQLEGPQVADWRREGSTIIVQLAAPTTGRVDVDARWSVAAPRGAEASLALPSLVPQQVFRSDAAVQVARDGEVDVRPQLDAWSPLASVQLPAWAEGLVEGTPTAAFQRSRVADDDGTLQLLRLEPVPGPPVVVDVADVRVAVTEQGRTLMRARFEVRNERASHLVVTPPPGMRPVGVTVAGRQVRPSLVDGALWIPLKRSIETVEGALTVPVTVGLLGEDGEAWARRERRPLRLPAVDAPVTVERVTVHLPPRYRSRLEPGQGAVVDAFDRGQGVGYGLDDDDRLARADQVFAEAVEAWNANEFERAQTKLDQLGALGAFGTNSSGLQANVDLVRPRPEPQPEPDEMAEMSFEDANLDLEPMAKPAASAPASALARRIRARARARAGDKKVQYERRKQKAKTYKDEGNYEAAAAEYRQAIEDGRDLDALEDEESVEYEFEASELADELSEVEAAADDDGGGQEADEVDAGGDDEAALSNLLPSDGELDLVSAAFGRWLIVADEPEPAPHDDDAGHGLTES
ncbi:MAG: hypothetical protein AB1Z98_10945, partial [Nannocystaceae bacterium]